MLNILKIIFGIITKYLLIDFIFFCTVLFFPENVLYFLQWLVSILTQIIEIPFFEKFPLDSFAFILFCITWTIRKRKLFNEGGFSGGLLTYKQIFGRFFIIITVIAMYIDKYILNSNVPQMSYVVNKSGLFFELLLCWSVAMMVVEMFNGIIFKLFKL